MSSVSITQETRAGGADLYRARADGHQALGRTAGEALDGLGEHLAAAGGTTVVVVQKIGPDSFFGAEQITRLADLMARWRTARDAGRSLSAPEEHELSALIESELDASARRAASLADQLP